MLPALVIARGQASGREDLAVERVAINVDDARIPDNAGAQPVALQVAASRHEDLRLEGGSLA